MHASRFFRPPACRAPRRVLAAVAIVSVVLGTWVGHAARGEGVDDGADLVRMVVELLRDPDKETRDLGLEQIRTEAKGPAATRQFAAQLATLSPDVQVLLLRALAERGDQAARAEVLPLIAKATTPPVRLAAIEALGALGDQTDIGRFVELLGADDKEVRQAAQRGLTRLNAKGVSADLIARLGSAPPELQVALIDVLSARHAADALPAILAAAKEPDDRVRNASLTVLGQLGRGEQIPGLVDCVLKAENAAQREAVEKAIMFICGRMGDPDARAIPLITAMQSLSAADRRTLLPALGRVGGTPARTIVLEALADTDPQTHEAALRALCNWPDATVAMKLIELARDEPNAAAKQAALEALIRVAPLPDQRTPQERLQLLQTVMDMCASPQDQILVIKRARAIRSVETLRYVLTFVDQPLYAQPACETIVELAHHRGLREPNKEEFDRALDRVIATSRDAVVIDRAERYKKGQTWTRPANAVP